jgi:glycosyltransferase involved in cell wall biosynthesis
MQQITLSSVAPHHSSPRSCLQGKRVAMVSYSQFPSDPRPRRAAESMVQEGMKVDMICIGDETEPRREVLNDIQVFRVRITHRRGGGFSYACRYAAFIFISASILALRSIKERYDLVHVHNMPDILILSALVPKALGARIALDMHDPMPELMTAIFGLGWETLAVRLIKGLERWSMKHADVVIAVNQACKNIFASRSCPAEKIRIVMNSPDENIFPLRPPGSRCHAGNQSDKPYIIMYHGSIVERNGLDLAIDALAFVRRSVPGVELRMYGRKTPFLEKMMEESRRKGLEDCVHFLGPKRLEDLVGEIEQCDVGIIPNHNNSFTKINTPTRIFEYLAMGKPVIAPKTPGIEDYFTGESLLFFSPGNPEELAEKMGYVYFHSREATEIARRGQQVYLAHTWFHERETLVDTVCGLLERRQ